MEKICRICGSKFETIQYGGSRQFCFDCVPQTENVNERTITKRQSIKKQGVKILGGKCQHCGETKYYLLDFHHLDRDEKEHAIANLIGDSKIEDFFKEIEKCVLLCGNCHRELHWLESNDKNFNVNEYITSNPTVIKQDLNREYSKIQYFCKECGNPITKDSESGLCLECSHKSKRIVLDRPDAATLIKEIKETNMVQVGKKYGVSDNAIRKWLKSYGLPTSSKDIKSMK